MSNFSEAERYADSCPFCKIAVSYPASAADAEGAIPAQPDAAQVQPKCFLVLSAPDVLAFLDIMPMTTGHVLVTTRAHREKLADVVPDEGQAMGMFCCLQRALLSLLCFICAALLLVILY